MNIIFVLYWVLLAALGIFSYGFIDLNLRLSTNQLFMNLQRPLSALVYHQRSLATGIFVIFLLSLFAFYLIFLRKTDTLFTSWKKLGRVILVTAVLLVLSFPALTYDIFNYIMTAKIAFTYHENPYVVMPIEIPNDPNLAFTRAANKLALYGPVWIALTAVPHYLGMGDIWKTIIAFKVMNAVVYIGFCYFIYRVTKKLTNVVFFALNPLVLIEILMNGHNDIYMMLFALLGLFLWYQKRFTQKAGGIILLASSWLVKGATLVLAPLLVFRRISFERMLIYAYVFLAAVFFIVAPVREELYPWYAVWLITTASLLPFKTHRYIVGFTVVLSFALELRALPYMWMGYYGGPGPALRFVLTAIPVGIYAGYVGFRFLAKRII